MLSLYRFNRRTILVVFVAILAFAMACERPNNIASAKNTSTQTEKAPGEESGQVPRDEPDEALFGVALGDSRDEIVKKKGLPKKEEAKEGKGVILEYDEKVGGWGESKAVSYYVTQSNNKERKQGLAVTCPKKLYRPLC